MEHIQLIFGFGLEYFIGTVQTRFISSKQLSLQQYVLLKQTQNYLKCKFKYLSKPDNLESHVGQHIKDQTKTV